MDWDEFIWKIAPVIVLLSFLVGRTPKTSTTQIAIRYTFVYIVSMVVEVTVGSGWGSIGGLIATVMLSQMGCITIMSMVLEHYWNYVLMTYGVVWYGYTENRLIDTWFPIFMIMLPFILEIVTGWSAGDIDDLILDSTVGLLNIEFIPHGEKKA
jgi:hypothetical protein